MSDEDRKRVEEATVFIEVKYRPLGKGGVKDEIRDEDKVAASGSGAIISSDGLILTNTHVVEAFDVYDPKLPAGSPAALAAQARRVFVRESVDVWIHCGTNRAKRLPAQVLCTRENPNDLALLRIRSTGLNLTALNVADGLLDPTRGPAIKKGQKVWAVGFPLGRHIEEGFKTYKYEGNPNGPDVAVRPGFISSLRHGEEGKLNLIEHSCGIEPGNSGGPLVDAAGELIGLNTYGLESSKKYDYAIPLETIYGQFPSTLKFAARRTVPTTMPARRVLVVESSDEKDAETRFRTLPAAVAAARDGDIIELNEGEHKIDKDFDIDKAVWVRGAGRDKTTLSGKPIGVTAGGFVELSDMKIRGGMLWIAPPTGREAYIHGLDFVEMNIEGSANIVDCRNGAIWVQKKARPRMERVVATVNINESEPTLLGCRLEESLDFMAPVFLSPGFYKSQVKMSGCELRYKMALGDSQCELKNNYFAPGTLLEVKGESRCEFEGNCFEGGTVLVSSAATFKSNFFKADRYTSMGAVGGGSVQAEDNFFYFDGRFHVRKDESGREEGIPEKPFAFGMGAANKNSRIAFKNNIFLSRKEWTKPYGADNESVLADEGGNNFKKINTTEGPGIVKD
ncbi:MAG: trypsin-like peptidase domain-containing protein [Planctomycetes bacterium]|nr:trypsin-like peptidase domain-containing protein [Planctomycetota bacterium]